MRHERTWLGTTDRYARLRKIESLDVDTDFREINGLFSADFRSVMLPMAFNGFLMTFATPRMSRILSASGEIENRVAKRVIDTMLLSSTVSRHGPAQGPGRDAARRVNAMHRQYDIHPEDFVAVACDTTLMALWLADNFGWRPVTDKERRAVLLYNGQMATAFGSRMPMPSTLQGVEEFLNRYAEAQYRFEPQNLRLANATIGWFTGLVSRPAAPLFRRLLLAVVDHRILRACGLEPPSRAVTWAAFKVMRHIGRRDPVADGAPDKMAALVKTVYPDAWEISRLGTHHKPAPS